MSPEEANPPSPEPDPPEQTHELPFDPNALVEVGDVGGELEKIHVQALNETLTERQPPSPSARAPVTLADHAGGQPHPESCDFSDLVNSWSPGSPDLTADILAASAQTLPPFPDWFRDGARPATTENFAFSVHRELLLIPVQARRVRRRGSAAAKSGAHRCVSGALKVASSQKPRRVHRGSAPAFRADRNAHRLPGP